MAKKPTAKRARARDALVNGDEVLSPVPMAPPVGYRREPSMVERIRSMVRSEHVRLAALQAGQETFEEADDFEIGDDYDPASPYEEVFEPVDYEARQRLRQEDYERSISARSEEIRAFREKNHGNASADEGRGSDDRSRSGKPRTKSKSKSSSEQDAPAKSGVSGDSAILGDSEA